MVRGEVARVTEEGARDHIDHLSQKDHGRPFRKMGPDERRVIYHIRPRRVSAH